VEVWLCVGVRGSCNGVVWMRWSWIILDSDLVSERLADGSY